MVSIIDLNNVLPYFDNCKVSISYLALTNEERFYLDLLDNEEQEGELTYRSGISN